MQYRLYFMMALVLDAFSNWKQQHWLDVSSCRVSEMQSMFAYNICLHLNGKCNVWVWNAKWVNSKYYFDTVFVLNGFAFCNDEVKCDGRCQWNDFSISVIFLRTFLANAMETIKMFCDKNNEGNWRNIGYRNRKKFENHFHLTVSGSDILMKKKNRQSPNRIDD